MSEVFIPPFDEMMNPVIKALRKLGGSGTIVEVNEAAASILGLTDEQLEVIHDPERSSRTEVEYRFAWARTYLKHFGILENSQRGVWALTPLGQSTEGIDEKEVRNFVRNLRKERASSASAQDIEDIVEQETTVSWRDEVMAALLQMHPSAFERLFQRVLRESGFIQVEVIGQTGDGGIDGVGIMRLGGLLSFHVMFQCKRWQSSIGASIVRDFRGAMVGRADKGLIVTTGTFTKDAVREATRDGAPAIDLIDGEALVDKLKELGLGVKIEIVQVESVTVDQSWFLGI